MVPPNFTPPGLNNNNTYYLYDFFPVHKELSIGISFDVQNRHLNACITIPILSSRKLRLREIQGFAQDLKTWGLR